MVKRCEHQKADGKQCGANALPRKRFCVFHDKASAAKRAEGRKKGGLASRKPAATLPPDSPPLRLANVADVTAALAETFNLVRTGRMAAPIGNCLGILAQGLLKAMERSDLVLELERRLEALEERRAG